MRKSNTPTHRIMKSLVFVEPDNNTISVDFKDKGLKIEVTDSCMVISTNFHKHIFEAVDQNGFSEPYIYIKHFVEIALKNKCMDKDEKGVEFYSYKKLVEKMESDETPRADYIIFQYCNMWLYNIYQPLPMLRTDIISSFIMYLNYVTNLANASVLLEENCKDMTNKQFIEKVIRLVREMTEKDEERVIIGKMEDKELKDKLSQSVIEQL